MREMREEKRNRESNLEEAASRRHLLYGTAVIAIAFLGFPDGRPIFRTQTPMDVKVFIQEIVRGCVQAAHGGVKGQKPTESGLPYSRVGLEELALRKQPIR